MVKNEGKVEALKRKERKRGGKSYGETR